MKKRDILAELALRKISPEEAQRVYDGIMDEGKEDFAEALSLSRSEATAFGHGVGLPELAEWRQSGWPVECQVCGQKIDIPKFGWIAKEQVPHGRHYIKHLSCPIGK